MSREAKLILLADDDAEDQIILKEAILQLDPGAKIHTVMNGQEAVEYLFNCTEIELPDLIVLDYKMPILNALEVLMQVQKDARFRPVPKVVWSSSNQQEYMKSCIREGALNYFVKPNNDTELMEIAEKMLDISNAGIADKL